MNRLSPLVYKDYISSLPYEIKLDILYRLDIKSLVHMSRVSKQWKLIIEDQQLWKDLYLRSGWSFNQRAVKEYLLSQRTLVEKSISTPRSLLPMMPRLRPFKAPPPILEKFALNPDSAVQQVCSSKSQPLSSFNRQEALSHIIKERPFINRPPLRRHIKYDETPIYHYKESTDTRYINWKRLYRNRSLIEKRWNEGKCKMRQFPSDASLEHSGSIYCLQFNNSILVTGSRDRHVKIWDINTGALLRKLEGHLGSVLCLQFDHRFLISGSSDAALIIWDIHTGERIKVIQGHEESVLNVKFKGNTLVSCSKDRTVRIWRLENSGDIKLHSVLRGHRAAVNAVQFKDNKVVSASGDRTIKIWDMTSGECLKTLDSHSRGIACVEYDGKYIISGSSDQTIKVWNAATGECIHTLVSHKDLVRTIQLDSKSKRIISGSYDGSLKIWGLENGILLRSLSQAAYGRILNLQFDFGKIICSTNLGKIIIYDFTYGIDTQFIS
ncbi:unnamed protein product [Rhizopus microsporus]|uniref:WD40 repeat-like protein n=1 Tax=Rhizopus microsporus TaxID=58291 RepID=A0A1X0S6E5_RHIZD|nr:WD40 repeat-like protein [Rhizopus microsporus]